MCFALVYIFLVYSIVNKTIKSSNQLPAGLLASFPCELNTFRKSVKNVVAAPGNPK
jgi:hypothetical protein